MGYLEADLAYQIRSCAFTASNELGLGFWERSRDLTELKARLLKADSRMSYGYCQEPACDADRAFLDTFFKEPNKRLSEWFAQ